MQVVNTFNVLSGRLSRDLFSPQLQLLEFGWNLKQLGGDYQLGSIRPRHMEEVTDLLGLMK